MNLSEAQLYELIVELQRRGLHVYNPDEMGLVERQNPVPFSVPEEAAVGDADPEEYGLVMPFVVCISKGGLYDDDAYIAGWEAGSLDIALMLSPLGKETVLRFPQAFHVGNRPQLDLIAMKHGLGAKFEDAAEGWAYLTLTAKP